MSYPTIESCIGKTPLVKLQRIHGKTSNTILVKL
ncbi:MAG: cysteine synthase B, partial [Porticoccus sp.]|nr:cysteine synthase B [Porticoccus sp.]